MLKEEISVGDFLFGYFSDDKKVRLSASGGLCTAISEVVIEKMHGVVFGAAYSSDFKYVEYVVAENVKQLSKMKGSKYISAKKQIIVNKVSKSVYDEVIKYLENNVPVVFVGLGCDVAALYKKCELKDINIKNLYTIDLICHGTTIEKVHTDYIEWLQKKFKSKVTSFSVRYKKKGWVPPYVHAEFVNGKIYEHNFYKTDYGKAFSKIARNGCYACPFKGDNHKADITAGDYWGMNSSMPLYNKNGVSLCSINSTKGIKLIELLDNEQFIYSLADKKLALANNPMYLANRKKDDKYNQFCDDLKKKNLFYAVVHYYGFIKGLYWYIKDTLDKE